MIESGEAFCRENTAYFEARADSWVCCITPRTITLRAPGDEALGMDHSFATKWAG